MLTASAIIRISPPAGENLNALERKLYRICCSFPGSVSTAGRSSATVTTIFNCLAIPCGRIIVSSPSIMSAILEETTAADMRPASIFAISKSSLIMSKSIRALVKILVIYRTRLGSAFGSIRAISESNSAKPMMEFSGVRNSCETFAKNSLFNRFDSNKPTFASDNSTTFRSSDSFMARRDC